MNSKNKGKRGERELVNILNKRFGENKFKRTPYSGALVGGINKPKSMELDKTVRISLTSDIICPNNFKFIIEHKFYKEANFWDFFNEKSNFCKWLSQVEKDSKNTGKSPMLIVKFNRHKRIAFFKGDVNSLNLSNYIIWRNYIIAMLEDILKLPDNFWLR